MSLDGRLETLGHHHNRIRLPLASPLGEQLVHPIHVVSQLGHENHVGRTGHTRVERNPSGMMTHHLDHHHPLMGAGRGVEPIDRLGRDVDGGVEPEGDVGAPDVVVDRLRHADHVQPNVSQQVGRLLRAVATDADQRIQPQLPVIIQDDLRLVRLGGLQLFAEGLLARGAQDGAAQVEDA